MHDRETMLHPIRNNNTSKKKKEPIRIYGHCAQICCYNCKHVSIFCRGTCYTNIEVACTAEFARFLNNALTGTKIIFINSPNKSFHKEEIKNKGIRDHTQETLTGHLSRRQIGPVTALSRERFIAERHAKGKEPPYRKVVSE